MFFFLSLSFSFRFQLCIDIFIYVYIYIYLFDFVPLSICSIGYFMMNQSTIEILSIYLWWISINSILYLLLLLLLLLLSNPQLISIFFIIGRIVGVKNLKNIKWKDALRKFEDGGNSIFQWLDIDCPTNWIYDDIAPM